MLKVCFSVGLVLIFITLVIPRPQYQSSGYWDGNRYVYPNGTAGPYWNGSAYYYPNTYPTQTSQIGSNSWGWTGGNYGPGGWYLGPSGWTYYPGWTCPWWMRDSRYPFTQG